MSFILYVIGCLGVLVEGLLLWRLARRRLWSRYPYFSAFVVYDIVRTIFLLHAAYYQREWFAAAYWRTEIVSGFLRFLVIWEVLRSVFPRNSVLRKLTWRVAASLMLFLLPSVVALSYDQALFEHYLYPYLSPVLEQYISLLQAIFLLVPVAVAVFYGTALGRNLRGLVFGFGTYLSVCAANFASLQAWPGFFPVWRFLFPLTYIGMTAVWLWAFWEYAPSRELAGAGREDCTPSGGEWRRMWTSTMKLLSGVIR
jgi:hypothetical protein